MATYRCKYCNKAVKRPRVTKAWVMSFCDTAGKRVRLMRVKK